MKKKEAVDTTGSKIRVTRKVNEIKNKGAFVFVWEVPSGCEKEPIFERSIFLILSSSSYFPSKLYVPFAKKCPSFCLIFFFSKSILRSGFALLKMLASVKSVTPNLGNR